MRADAVAKATTPHRFVVSLSRLKQAPPVRGLTSTRWSSILPRLTVVRHRLILVAALAGLTVLLLAAPALAQQQPNYQPAPQQPNYQPAPQQPSNQGGGNAPSQGGGQAPTPQTAPSTGAAPGNAGAGPGATTRPLPSGQTLPVTGFGDGSFLAALGFVLLLSGVAIRRACSPDAARFSA